MKLVLNIDYNHSLIVPEKHQASMLAILQDSALYTNEGYGDKTYNLSDKLPEIVFVRDNQINGLEGALEEARNKLAERNTDYYKMMNDKGKLEKEITELRERFTALEAVFVPPLPLED